MMGAKMARGDEDHRLEWRHHAARIQARDGGATVARLFQLDGACCGLLLLARFGILSKSTTAIAVRSGSTRRSRATPYFESWGVMMICSAGTRGGGGPGR